jgi:diacylglycerol kinase family enzyme
MGTANNVGATLGITARPLPDIIRGWSAARGVSFDAGVAEGPWGSECFIEGFGIGLFAESMLQLDEKENKHLTDSGETHEIIQSVLGILKQQLQRYQPKKMAVRLDGKDFSGDYLLLEALNIRYIGPNLDLVPRADIKDGLLDVVFVTARERAKLSKRLGDLIKHKPTRPDLLVRRGRHLQIEWENSPVHIDDRPWPEDDNKIHVRSNAIDVKIEPAALVFLVPATKPRATKLRAAKAV